MLRSVPHSLNTDKEELVAFAAKDSGSCWSVEEYFSVSCYSIGLYSLKRWDVFGHPANLSRAGHVVQPQNQVCFRQQGIHEDLYFHFFLLGMKWLIFKSWIFSLYKSDNQMPNISSRWWVCQETINWKEQISPEKEERTVIHEKILPMDVSCSAIYLIWGCFRCSQMYFIRDHREGVTEERELWGYVYVWNCVMPLTLQLSVINFGIICTARTEGGLWSRQSFLYQYSSSLSTFAEEFTESGECATGKQV